MAVPTRFIEQAEFDELMKTEGDTLSLYKLSAIEFSPPTHDAVPAYDNYPTVRVLMLNVTEPRLYRDEQKIVFVVYPSTATMGFHDAQDMHPVKAAWCYRLAPYSWDEDSALVSATYFFHDDTVPEFILEDEETH